MRYRATLGWKLVVVCAWCLSASAHVAPAAETLKPGAAFPDLAAFPLAGELPDRTAARVVIIDFWASWCPPCKASFPVYNELQRKFGSQGLLIIGVSVDQDERAMQRFVQREQPAFPIVRDVRQQLVAAVSAPTMPTAFVLDAKGDVRFVHVGFLPGKSETEYINQITALLAEPP